MVKVRVWGGSKVLEEGGNAWRRFLRKTSGDVFYVKRLETFPTGVSYRCFLLGFLLVLPGGRPLGVKNFGIEFPA